MEGMLIVLSGPSGAGKGTICKQLLKEADIEYSVSATTRNPRPGEEEGREYFFINKEQFEEKIENDEFLEWARVYDNYYGTPNDFVEKIIQKGHHCILEIDPQGAEKVREKRPDAVYIFIVPPSMHELKERLTNRGTENDQEIEKRLSNVREELSYVEIYDYIVVNDKVEKAVKKVKAILEAEQARVKRVSKYTLK